MSNDKSRRISKFLSLILRHSPEKIGIKLDKSGWVDTESLISKMNDSGNDIDLNELEEIVETNNKKRFSFNDDKTKIRANQGHSIKEIDHGFVPIVPPILLFHGTGKKSVPSILKTGIEKRNRHHVHLSADVEVASEVGKRHGSPAILKIMAHEMYMDGYDFFLSENGVWLTDNVPTKYIK